MPPNARELVESCLGRTIYTLDKQLPNAVMRIVGADVLAATNDSPDGKPVALRHIQDGLDILYAEG